jgi:hypothetical protein
MTGREAVLLGVMLIFMLGALFDDVWHHTHTAGVLGVDPNCVRHNFYRRAISQVETSSRLPTPSPNREEIT